MMSECLKTFNNTKRINNHTIRIYFILVIHYGMVYSLIIICSNIIQ